MCGTNPTFQQVLWFHSNLQHICQITIKHWHFSYMTHVNQETEIDHHFQQIVNLQMERSLESFPHHLCQQWFHRHPKKFIMHSRLGWATCAHWRPVWSAANGLWEVIITARLAGWSSVGQDTWPVQLQCLSIIGILWWCLVSLGPERRGRKTLLWAMKNISSKKVRNALPTGTG